jgi:NADH-quinone oxidoreductase subunit L
MTVPLIVLAVLSIIGGFIGIPASLGGGNQFEHFLEPVFEQANMKLALPLSDSVTVEYLLMIVSLLVAVGGILAARYVYLRRNDIAEAATRRFASFYRLLFNKYYVDEVYDAAIVMPIKKTSEKLLWNIVDIRIIDGTINFAAKASAFTAEILRRIQTGVTQSYAIIFVVGILFVISWLFVR